jgi:hypothetical protein
VEHLEEPGAQQVSLLRGNPEVAASPELLEEGLEEGRPVRLAPLVATAE